MDVGCFHGGASDYSDTSCHLIIIHGIVCLILVSTRKWCLRHIIHRELKLRKSEFSCSPWKVISWITVICPLYIAQQFLMISCKHFLNVFKRQMRLGILWEQVCTELMGHRIPSAKYVEIKYWKESVKAIWLYLT